MKFFNELYKDCSDFDTEVFLLILGNFNKHPFSLEPLVVASVQYSEKNTEKHQNKWEYGSKWVNHFNLMFQFI